MIFTKIKLKFMYFLLCIGFFILNSCKYEDSASVHHRIYVRNQSPSPIYVEHFGNTANKEGAKLAASRAVFGYKNFKEHRLYEGEEYCIFNTDPWEGTIKDTILVFIFDAVRLESKDSMSCLVRYDLSLEDLYALDWHLSYPPSIDMKDMMMNPSFDSLFVSQ